MKFKFGLVLIPVLFFIISFPVNGEQIQSLPEGMKPYIPTRLEWLACELNASFRVEMNDMEGYDLSFVSLDAENTILILVSYTRQTRRDLINMAIDRTRKRLQRLARARGWDSWLKIREELNLIDQK